LNIKDQVLISINSFLGCAVFLLLCNVFSWAMDMRTWNDLSAFSWVTYTGGNNEYI